MARLSTLTLAVSFGLVLPPCSAEQTKTASPFPADIAAAWQKAGARVGWMRLNRFPWELEFRVANRGQKKKYRPLDYVLAGQGLR